MNPNSITCPFCNSVFPKIDSSYRIRTPSFATENAKVYARNFAKSIENMEELSDAIAVEFAVCPACEKTSIRIEGAGREVQGIKLNFHPSSTAKQFPSYIPSAILQDYEEACKIVNLSPKASATLSRRCLQGMIRNYWGVTGKKNLYEEIDAIQNEIDPQVSKVLSGVRQIGNIGAHMEKDIDLIIDIDPGEATQLIKLIEYLMEQWYIKRHETDEMLKSILNINGEKQEKRKG